MLEVDVECQRCFNIMQIKKRFEKSEKKKIQKKYIIWLKCNPERKDYAMILK